MLSKVFQRIHHQKEEKGMVVKDMHLATAQLLELLYNESN